MNRICAVLAVVVVLAGCASNEPVADTGPVSEPPPRVELETKAPARTIQWPMPRRPVMVGDPMPFGDSMFGPWRTGLEPDPSFPRAVGRFTVEPVTVDFVGMSLHMVLRYIAARGGLVLAIDTRAPDPRVTVMFRDVDPKEAIRTLCKANKLDLVEEGSVWIIRARPADELPVNVTKGDFDGHYHVDFDEQEIVVAIMQVARVTGAQVLIPSVWHDADDEEDEAHVLRIQEQPITLSVRNATPDHILRELARLGNMDIEVIVAEGDQPAYKFKYRK
jgi:hypothetical protein